MDFMKLKIDLIEVKGLRSTFFVDRSCVVDDTVTIHGDGWIRQFVGKFEEEDMVFVAIDVA